MIKQIITSAFEKAIPQAIEEFLLEFNMYIRKEEMKDEKWPKCCGNLMVAIPIDSKQYGFKCTEEI